MYGRQYTPVRQPRRLAPAAYLLPSRRRLQQLPKLIFSEPRVADDAAHGECVHGVVSWDGYNPDAVSHYDVLTLAGDSKAGLLQDSDGILMIDAGDLRHAS
jgi:hypothetical protein